MIVAPAAAQIECFRGLVAERLGLHCEDSKLDFLADVLRRRMEETGCHLFSEYRKRISPFADERSETGALAEQLTVGETLAEELGDQNAACLLSGMGRDGAAGLLALRHAGALTIAQDEASSVVFGMPREAIQMGAADRVLALGQIAPALAEIAQLRELRK